MKRTKILVLFLVFAMTLGLCACTGSGNESNVESTVSASEDVSAATEDVVIKVGGLKGPTSIGMVKLMKDNKESSSVNKYQFDIQAAADALVAPMVKGELDIAAVPANLASVLYKRTEGKVKLLAVNTLGVLYIVHRGESLTLNDLKGKTVYATGQGAVPEYALRYVLSQNGINPDTDLTIEWKSQPDEIVPLLASNEDAIAMLPQPYVTVASSKISDLSIAIDLTKEWDNLNLDSRLITGTLVVRAEFVEEHPDLVANFLVEYEASTKYVNENVEAASALVEEFGIVNAAVAKKAIPYCNIVFISGDEMKTPVNAYLKTVLDQNPTAVGGELPDENFYYSAK